MKLRQKSYLLTVLLITLVLHASVLFVLLPNIRMTVSSAEARALGEEKALALAADRLFEDVAAEDRPIYARAFSIYDSGGATFAIGSDDATWVLVEPAPPVIETGRIRWIEQDGRTLLTIADTLSDGIWLRYALDETATIRRLKWQSIGAALLCTALTAAIAAALYIIQERVYRPIDRLAHELRTPLTVIRGYGELLERTKLTPEQQHTAAGYIVAESERLGEISQKLLTMSDARTRAYRPERVDLHAIAAHLKNTYPTLNCEIGCDTMTADRALLLSMLGNLIGNAVKASAAGSPVQMRIEPGMIEITDRGRGMNAQQLAYVNDPSHARNPSIRSGLGVPLCHEIAALHSATLRFTSVEGEGTTATVLFTS